MNGNFAEAALLFASSLLLALTALLAMRTDYGWAVIFAVLSAAMGDLAFCVIFTDIHRTAKLFRIGLGRQLKRR